MIAGTRDLRRNGPCHWWRLIRAGVAVLALQACTDPESLGPTAPVRHDIIVGLPDFTASLKAAAADQIAAAANGRSERGIEDDILRLEAATPTVGGMFLDSTRTALVAWVKDPARDEATRRALAAYLAKHQSSALSPLAHVRDIVIRRGQFAFSELVAGQQALAILPNTRLVTLDADEFRNRISVGVLDSTGLRQVYSDARRAGIPASALVVTVMRAPRINLDLTARFRPTMGGVVVDAKTPFDGYFACSLGWNVSRVDSSGVRYYITAAHCLKEYVQQDWGPAQAGVGNYQFQPGNTSADALGTLSYVANWNESGCDGAHGTLCTSSDVMQWRYSSSVSSTKVIAMTRYVGTSSAAGSTDQYATFTPFGLTSTMVNESVDKVGYHSGWTRGTIVNTCETVYFDISGRPIAGQNWEGHKCMFRTSGMAMWAGDSGSPLFLTPWPSTPDQAAAIGIMIGDLPGTFGLPCSNPCLGWGTDWSHIEAKLAMPYGGGLVPY